MLSTFLIPCSANSAVRVNNVILTAYKTSTWISLARFPVKMYKNEIYDRNDGIKYSFSFFYSFECRINVIKLRKK